MVNGGRHFLIGLIASFGLLFGAFGAAAEDGPAPYAQPFQDLDVAGAVAEDTVRLGGGGFVPNSDIDVRIVDNGTGAPVYKSTQTADAVGRAELELTLDEPLPPGSYTATVEGMTTDEAAIRLSGALAGGEEGLVSAEEGSALGGADFGAPPSLDSATSSSSSRLLLIVSLAVAVGLGAAALWVITRRRAASRSGSMPSS